jgi:dTDP-4-dehydrorhamnose 3,5-epimerase
MKFSETKLPGAFIIELEPIPDERGFFARSWCKREFEKHGLNQNLSQCNISFNHLQGTLRGMHFQNTPHEESKFVRCTRGAIYDVIVDTRAHSKTFGKWVGIELTAENRRMLYVPEGFAHGYLTLENNSEVFYQVSEFFVPASEGGFRYDDPTVGIHWPREIKSISPKDQALKAFTS